MATDFDLTDSISTFSLASVPIILKQTKPKADISGQIVAIEISAHGGVKLSPKAGVLTILSEVLPNGTYSYSKEEIDQLLRETGASLSVAARLDRFVVSLKCLKKYLPKLLPLLSELMRVPLLEEKEISLARESVRSALRGERENPDALLRLVMDKAFYQNHPYHNRPEGYLSSIDDVTRQDLSGALFQVFNQQNLLVVIVGELEKDEVEKLFQPVFTNLQEGERTQDPSQDFSNNIEKLHFKEFDAPTSYFLARFEAPSLADEDYPAMVVGTRILRGRLFDEVRTKRSLTYSVHANMMGYRNNYAQLYVTSTKLPETVKVMFEEVKKLQVDPIDEKTLELTRKKFLSQWLLGRETRSEQAAVLSVYEIFGIGWENSNSFMERIERVTPAKVREVFQKYFKEISYAVVGPTRPQLKAVLQPLGFWPRETKEETPEKEDSTEKTETKS